MQEFSQECKNLKRIFLKLKYPEKLIDSAINRVHHPPDLIHTPSDSPIRIIMPYKDQKSADVVRKQLRDLGRKIDHELQPIFTSKKIVDDLRETALKPPIVITSRALFMNLNLVCVIQIILGTHAAIYTNVLRSTNIP